MSIDVYAGFKTQHGVTSFTPDTLEAQVKYYSTVLRRSISQADIQVWDEIRDRAFQGDDPDMELAWWRVYADHPLTRVRTSLCNAHWLARQGIVVEHDGHTTDKELMRRILRALELNPDAADRLDQMYWG
jgi:hypothetical protein